MANHIMRPSIGSVPQPDPTILTTQQVLREVGALKELIRAEIEAFDRAFCQRLDDMDKALALLQHHADKVPSSMHIAVNSLRELHEAKFVSIDNQFVERKEAFHSAIKSAADVVTEHNNSNQQAVAKSEIAFTKQIDQIGASIHQTNKTLDDRISDVKDRLNLVESATKAVGDVTDLRSRMTAIETRALSSRDTQKDIWGYFVGVIGIVISIVTVLFLVINNTNRIEKIQGKSSYSTYSTMIG